MYRYDYIGNARTQISKYENAIEDLKNAKKKYEDSILEISDIKGFKSAQEVKVQLENKLNEINSQINFINDAMDSIMSKAKTLQREQEERLKAEEEANKGISR